MDKHMQAFASWDNWTEFEVNGETFLTPFPEDMPDDAEVVEVYQDMYCGRLSAPGYSDCTDWHGPYYTEIGAKWGLYDLLGNTDETFFDFIGRGKMIVAGSLNVQGSRNELYGRAVGEGEVHLATLGDSDIGPDPNLDLDLPEAYDFEVVDDLELRALEREIASAERDSEFYKSVTVYIGWSDRTWGTTTVKIAAERPDFEDRAVQQVTAELDQQFIDPNRLTMNGPEIAFIGVYHVDSGETLWKDADLGLPDLENPEKPENIGYVTIR